MKRSPLSIGNFTPGSSTANATYIDHADQLEQVQPGQVIAPLGDYLMQWDEDCLPPSQLEPMRHLGDPLCDQVVRELHLKHGSDGLQMLMDRLASPDAPHCLRQFWGEINRLPSGRLDASHDDMKPGPSLARPDYHPSPTLSQGQAVFWRYSSGIFSALLHYSLAGGFSATRVVNVLRETNYLTGEGKDRTYKRLLETTQAIIDYMTDMTPVTGIGWKSAVRVRMLHSTVRTRLLDGKGIKKTYNVEADGLPINQEDLLATLGSFAIAPLWALRRSGVHLSSEEEHAYVATWRHIGYYLGISPDNLDRFYAGSDTVSRASKVFACMTMHLFTVDTEIIDAKATNTYRLLSAVADRPPRPKPIEHQLAVSRFLLGDGLADRLLIPRTPARSQWHMVYARWAEWSLIAFGRHYRKGWEVERVACTRLLISMLVCWQLGVRRTKFTVKTFIGDFPVANEQEVESDDEKNKVETFDDDDLDPNVTMGVEAGKRIIRRWKHLVYEMGAVLVGVIGASVGGSYLLYRSVGK